MSRSGGGGFYPIPSGRPRLKVKKGFEAGMIGLPFPNFALGKTELPAICHCVFDGDKFYVTNDKDMHTLHQNGAFGMSSLTNRGLSYNDPEFFMKPYFAKHLDQIERGSRNIGYANGSVRHVRTSCTLTKSNFGIKKARLEFFNSSDCVPGQEDRLLGNGNQAQASPCHANGSSTSSGGFRSMENSRRQETFGSSSFVAREDVFKSIASKLNFEDERLILMPEEAIFLSFGVGCLSIHNPGGEMLEYKKVWKRLVETNPEFPISYAVYHYFRSKNWVPKLADSYGAAYVLYEVGPSMHHSSYIVQILGLPSRPIPTWNELHAWMRLASQSNKSLLICEVSLPLTFNAGISEPRSIFEMSLKETSLFRWTPKQIDLVKC